MEPRPRNLEKSEAVPPIQTRKTRLEGLVRKEPLCVWVELISRRSVGPRGAEPLCGEIGSHRTGHRARAVQHRAAQGDGRREAPGLVAQMYEDPQMWKAELLTLQMSSLPLAGPLPRSPGRLASLANRQETPKSDATGCHWNVLVFTFSATPLCLLLLVLLLVPGWQDSKVARHPHTVSGLLGGSVGLENTKPKLLPRP